MDYFVSFFERFRISDQSEISNAYPYITVDPDDILIEGDLLENNKDSDEFEPRHCILTKKALISSKIQLGLEAESLESTGTYIINLGWPEMRKIRAENYLGFILRTHKSKSFTFLFSGPDDTTSWYKALSQICMQQDIMLDYSFLNVLGTGGNAIVWKALNKSTQETVAIKCYNKIKLYEHSEPEVFFYCLDFKRKLC